MSEEEDGFKCPICGAECMIDEDWCGNFPSWYCFDCNEYFEW